METVYSRDMVWKYRSGDLYNLRQLNGFKEFFLQNLEKKRTSLQKAYTYERYGLPGFRWTILRLTMGVEDAEENVRVVNFAISENLNNV